MKTVWRILKPLLISPFVRQDLLQLVRYCFGGMAPSVETRSRLSALLDVLRDCAPSVHPDVWDLGDPLPWLQDLLDTFRPSNFSGSGDRW